MSVLEPGSSYWSVVVIDMYHYQDPEEGELIVGGFPTAAAAIEYARRRMRSTVEECRPGAHSLQDLRMRWHMFGEDCVVPGTGYMGLDDLDEFIAHPATPEEIDWVSLDPDLELRAVVLRYQRGKE